MHWDIIVAEGNPQTAELTMRSRLRSLSDGRTPVPESLKSTIGPERLGCPQIVLTMLVKKESE